MKTTDDSRLMNRLIVSKLEFVKLFILFTSIFLALLPFCLVFISMATLLATVFDCLLAIAFHFLSMSTVLLATTFNSLLAIVFNFLLITMFDIRLLYLHQTIL